MKYNDIAKKFERHVPVYYGSKFVWEGKTGVSEASSLGISCTNVPHGPCYLNEMGGGVVVESHITGTQREFLLTETEMDDSHTIKAWHFMDVIDNELRIVILND